MLVFVYLYCVAQEEIIRQRQEEKMKKLQEIEMKRQQAAILKEQVNCLFLALVFFYNWRFAV
jgi:hypothetical protein